MCLGHIGKSLDKFWVQSDDISGPKQRKIIVTTNTLKLNISKTTQSAHMFESPFEWKAKPELILTYKKFIQRLTKKFQTSVRFWQRT